MVRRESEQDTHRAKSASPTDTSSPRRGIQRTEGREQIMSGKSRGGDHFCLRGSVFTQLVDDLHGQLNAEEHEEPASSPQAPGLYTVILMFSGKDLLRGTAQTPVRGRRKHPTYLISRSSSILCRKASWRTSAVSSPKYSISRVSPDLVLKGSSCSPLCMATTLTWGELEYLHKWKRWVRLLGSLLFV